MKLVDYNCLHPCGSKLKLVVATDINGLLVIDRGSLGDGCYGRPFLVPSYDSLFISVQIIRLSYSKKLITVQRKSIPPPRLLRCTVLMSSVQGGPHGTVYSLHKQTEHGPDLHNDFVNLPEPSFSRRPATRALTASKLT